MKNCIFFSYYEKSWVMKMGEKIFSLFLRIYIRQHRLSPLPTSRDLRIVKKRMPLGFPSSY
jgi:hypothetical protein